MEHDYTREESRKSREREQKSGNIEQRTAQQQKQFQRQRKSNVLMHVSTGDDRFLSTGCLERLSNYRTCSFCKTILSVAVVDCTA
jgi:hypothetical protein